MKSAIQNHKVSREPVGRKREKCNGQIKWNTFNKLKCKWIKLNIIVTVDVL